MHIGEPLNGIGQGLLIDLGVLRPDPPVLIGSSDRVRAVLGWMPRRSALELQIADAWKWMQSRACA